MRQAPIHLPQRFAAKEPPSTVFMRMQSEQLGFQSGNVTKEGCSLRPTDLWVPKSRDYPVTKAPYNRYNLQEELPIRHQKTIKPKAQMTKISTGLRESKSSSIRTIRDPEAVLRAKRKLMVASSLSTANLCSPSRSKSLQPILWHREMIAQPYADAHNTITKQRNVVTYKDSTGRSEVDDCLKLVDLELDDEEIDRTIEITQPSRRKLQIEDDIRKAYDIENESRVANIAETERIREKKPKQKMTRDTQAAAKYIPEIHQLKGTIYDSRKETKEIPESFTNTPISGPEKKSNKKEKKNNNKKPKKLFKKLYKIKSAKVAPVVIPDKKPKKPTRDDLERIADMFCVERRPQGSVKNQTKAYYEDDSDDDCFRPGVWSCDFGDQRLFEHVDDEIDMENVDDGRAKVTQTKVQATCDDVYMKKERKKKSLRSRIVYFFRRVFARK